MLEKLDNQALALIYSAVDMARRFGHESVTVDHLVLAMSSMDNTMGQTFRLSGLKPDEIRDQIEKTYGNMGARLPEPGRSVPFSPEVDELFEQLACKVGAANTNGQISLMDVATALLYPGQGVVRKILYGLKACEDRPQSIDHMTPPAADSAGVVGSNPLFSVDSFDEEVQALINCAIDEARAFGHSYIGAEHLLLAMSKASDMVGQGLRTGGFKPDLVKEQIEILRGRNPAHMLDLSFNDEVKSLFANIHNAVTKSDSKGNINLYSIANELMLNVGIVRDVLQAISRPDKWKSLVEQFKQNNEVNVLPMRNDLVSDRQLVMSEGDLTEAANYVLLFARTEAATFKIAGNNIDTTSLLAGLVLDQCGWAGAVLRLAGIDIRAIRGAAGLDIAAKFVPSKIDCFLFDPNCRRILLSARKKCRLQRQSHVTTMHLLWAILSGGESNAKKILSLRIEDLAKFRGEVNNYLTQRYDGSVYSLELNEVVYKTILAGNSIPSQCYVTTESGATTSITKADSFDLSCLDPQSLRLMKAAIPEYSADSSSRLEAKHLFLALLADGRSAAAQYLQACGVTFKLARSSDAFRQVPKPKPMRQDTLDLSVAELLVNALAVAHEHGFSKIAPEHLLYAMLISQNNGLRALMDGLHLQLDKVKADMQSLCRNPEFKYFVFSPQFARIRSSGLHIYGMVCEPAVGVAMQTALLKATECGAPSVDGKFLFYGLCSTSCYAGQLLRSYEIKVDFAVKPKDSDPATAKKKIKGAKKAPAAKQVVASKSSEINFESSIEDAFYKALERSLFANDAAVSTEHILYGLLESENQEFFNVLVSNGVSPQAMLFKVRNHLRSGHSRQNGPQAILDLIAKTNVVLSSTMWELMRVVADLTLAMGVNVITADLLVYAVACLDNEPLAKMLLDCGLDVFAMKLKLQREADHYPRIAADEPFMSLKTLSILSQAAKIAEGSDLAQVHCEHLLMAIVDAEILQEKDLPGLNIDRLELCLYTTLALTERTRAITFGETLHKTVRTGTRLARSVLLHAAAIAVESGRNFLDCEHVLLAIAACRHKELRMFLLDNGLTKTRVEEIAAKYITRIVEYNSAPLTLSEPLESQLKWANNIAEQRHRRLGVEEILLAMVSKPSGVAAAIFSDLNIERTLFARSLENFITQERSRHLDPSIVPTSNAQGGADDVFKLDVSHSQLILNASTWYHRASMAHNMGRWDLSVEALMHWWRYLQQANKLQGLPEPDPPKTPEFYFGAAKQTAKPDMGAANKPAVNAPDPYVRLPISTDHSLIAAETSLIIGRAYNLAAKYIFPPEPAAEFVRPIHILLATVQAPEYADLIFGTNAQKGLLALSDAVRSRCISAEVGAPGTVNPAPEAQPPKMELSDISKAVLLAAFNESRTFSGSQLSLRPEHLLLALVEHDPWTAELLTEIGFDVVRAKKAILWYIDIRGR